MGSTVPTKAWQVRVGADGFSGHDVDTVQLEQLREPFELESTLEMTEQRGTDPYSSTPSSKRPTQRHRTLDDMRKLDKEMRQARPPVGPPPMENALPTATRPKRLSLTAIRTILARWFGSANG